jgi:hypothetical protein
VECLAPSEVEARLNASGFYLYFQRDSGRKALRLEESIRSRQHRIGGRVVSDAARLPHFVEAINRWLPTNRWRILWVESWNPFFPSVHDVFISARKGLGEYRSLEECPGHYFRPHDYDMVDQLEMPHEQIEDVNILTCLAILILSGGWDAILLANNCNDTIEFWEENILFNSSDMVRIECARSIMENFDCQIGII